jgi:hypothetical protein
MLVVYEMTQYLPLILSLHHLHDCKFCPLKIFGPCLLSLFLSSHPSPLYSLRSADTSVASLRLRVSPLICDVY